MKNLPILPLRDIVIFPDMIVPLFVGRQKSVIAIEEVMKVEEENKNILLSTQKDPLTDVRTSFDIFLLTLTYPSNWSDIALTKALHSSTFVIFSG